MTDAATRPAAAQTPASLAALASSSYELIVAEQHASGAYPASPTFSAYAGYSWFRDGAFTADAVSAYGGVESAGRFFDWCAGVLQARSASIERIVQRAGAGNPVPDAEMLATRFALDGTEGTDDWWDFQLDGYGTWLWALAEHAERHGVDTERWQVAVELSVDYLLSSWRRSCFDWWEEHASEVHVSTLGCIAAGLRAVSRSGLVGGERRAGADAAVAAILDLIEREGTSDGHLAKWLGSAEVDASLLAVISPLGVVDARSELGRRTVAAVDEQLNADGGVHRYLADTFYGGGQWPLLSCFLGLARLAGGDRAGALDALEWAASTAADDGQLPEQVGRHLLAPDRTAEWVDRWGEVASPLLWSHAMYLRLAVDLGVVAPLGAEGDR
ncbi:glycoside hydrolase family 15 protein [Herbiconiux ginsengi]|uniref:Glycosyl hydrolases family 15 n=1 Tax=Herbiconiux ginsengi TaxID=381665 RepID=A0A1H3RYJ5_9MICO|nr:glycoside hydrolase family 15 protein [Herbiconiux ginsengi]SDZ30744.1 Glycosyl hydrolases family 15 [Herbiconiux ginsengi]